MKKKKAKSKTTASKTYTTDEVKRHLGSLAEDFQHKVSAIGEQFLGLNESIAILKDESRRHHKENMEKLAFLYHTTQVIQSDVSDIKSGMKKKVDYDEFAALARRVMVLERKTAK